MSPPFSRHRTSRRRLLQFLAASPLLPTGEALAQIARFPDRLISSPQEALNVFDFEAAMQKAVPPAHYGYMATGIDDEVTLRANRDGFQKFQLRPRRLVDVSSLDLRMELFGRTYASPIVIAPTVLSLAAERLSAVSFQSPVFGFQPPTDNKRPY